MQERVRKLRDALDPDLVLQDGNIICMDPANSIAQAVAVKDKKIIAVGSNEEIQSIVGNHTEVINLGRKTVLPGFIDTHFHPAWYIMDPKIWTV